MQRDPLHASEEAELMVRLAQASAADRDGAVLELYDRYGGRLYGIGLRLLRDRGLAEELVQETFIRLWRSAPRFDARRGSVATFVFTIARRTAVDLQRRVSSRPLAERLGLPLGTVKTRTFYGLKALKSELEQRRVGV